jgi:hypothetical protein
LSSFQRVQEFLAQLPADDAAASLGAQAAELDEVISRLSSNAVDQEAGRRFVRVHSESQRRLRRALYADHMQPISRVAREVFGASGMDRAFRMPATTTANQTVLAAAGAMAEAAQKEKDVFGKHGLRPDFIDQLKACAAALDTARNAKVESGRRRVTATADVQKQVKRGRKAVRLLNAILQPRLAKDPELLAAWRSAKHVPPATPTGSDGAVATPTIEKVA